MERMGDIEENKQQISVLDLTVWNSDTSKRINRIAAEMRPLYVELISEVGNKYERDIDWWFSSVASRNTFAGSVFFYCCYLKLIRELINEGNKIDQIIVDSYRMKRIIGNFLKSADKSIKVKLNITKINKLKERLKSITFLNIINTWRLVFKQILTARLTMRYLKDEDWSAEVILIDTFLLENSASENVADHFYPNLLSYLTKEEKERVYFVPTYYEIKNYIHAFKSMRSGNINYVIKEDYLRCTDYLYAFDYFFRVCRKFDFKGVNLCGIDLEEILFEEMHKNSISFSSIEAILKYKLTQRLKEKNIKVGLVINWFENQVIDHGLNAGFRKYYPETPIWGYQSFAQPDNYLCVYPTEQEKRCQVIPNRVLVMGQGLVNKAKRYCPTLEVAVAPPMRYWWIWEERGCFPDKDHYTILIPLPYSTDEGSRFLILLDEISQTIENDKYRFWIKPHPTNSISKIKVNFGRTWPEKFQVVEGNIYDYLDKADLVITTSSGICLETISRGIPLICMAGISGIIRDYIPEDIEDDIWTLCFTKNELLNAISWYSNRDKETIQRHEQSGRKIREMFFEPVTRTGVRNFLKLQD